MNLNIKQISKVPLPSTVEELETFAIVVAEAICDTIADHIESIEKSEDDNELYERKRKLKQLIDKA
jgi:hypothetical protein